MNLSIERMALKSISVFIVFVFAMYSCSLFANQLKQEKDSINNLLQGVENDSAHVYLLVNMSNLYSSSDIRQAIILAEDAMEIAHKSQDEGLLSFAMFNAGNAYFYQGMYETATGYFYKYLEIQKRINNQSGIAYALANIGAIRIKMQDFEKAKQSFLEGLKILEELSIEDNQGEIKSQIPNIINNLGIVYQNLQEFDSALWYYREAIKLSEFSEDQQYFQAIIYNNIGGLFLDHHMPDSAFIPLNKSMEVRMERKDLAGQAASYSRLAEYYLYKGENQKAVSHFYKGLGIALEIGSIDLQSIFTEKLYLFYKQSGVSDSALRYYELHHKFIEEINNTETLMELTRLELSSQFKEKEKLAQIEQDRLNAIYLFAAFILILILLVFILLYFFLSNRLRRVNLEKNNMALSAQNINLEKENLEKELEIRNKELTTHVMSIIRKNELIGQIVELLSKNMNPDNEAFLHKIIKDLASIQDESVWKEFEIRYQQVHTDFYKKLQTVSPNLSTNERRLCAFLRLNMTTKDIVSITGQSQRSIEVARTRLRKKLQITNSEISLVEFLASL